MVLAGPALAGPPVLDLPLDCTLGQTCYIEDYVDANPGEGQSDYTCGLKSRDGHRGTDIALLSLDAMARGVDVLAAAPGIVAATRDGVPDQPVSDENRDQIQGRECGNAVRIDHGDGWQTLYCHMAKGSVRVRKGDSVAPGDILGKVGLSGQTNFPHLHLAVLKDDHFIDPFAPNPEASCGAPTGSGLWREALGYDRAGLFTAGFSTAVPSFDDVKSGAARRHSGPPDRPIVLYAHAFYPETGDILTFSATGPEGTIFDETAEIDDPKAQIFRAVGLRNPEGGWPTGDYRGTVTLRREGRVLAVRHTDFTVER